MTSDIFWTIIIVLGYWILYLLRNTWLFGWLYWLLIGSLLMLLAVLGLNFMKKEVKEWWSKDQVVYLLMFQKQQTPALYGV